MTQLYVHTGNGLYKQTIEYQTTELQGGHTLILVIVKNRKTIAVVEFPYVGNTISALFMARCLIRTFRTELIKENALLHVLKYYYNSGGGFAHGENDGSYSIARRMFPGHNFSRQAQAGRGIVSIDPVYMDLLADGPYAKVIINLDRKVVINRMYTPFNDKMNEFEASITPVVPVRNNPFIIRFKDLGKTRYELVDVMNHGFNAILYNGRYGKLI